MLPSRLLFSDLSPLVLPAYFHRLTSEQLPPYPLSSEDSSSSLFTLNRREIVIGTLLRLGVSVSSVFGSTYLLRALLSWLGEEESTPSTGYLWALALVGNYFLNAFLSHQAFWSGCVIALKTKEILTRRLYATSATTKSPAPDNYLTVDIEKISSFCLFLFYSLIAPVDALVTFGLLIWLLGYAAIPAIIGVLLFFPLQYYFSSKTVQWRPDVMRASDSRLSLLRESLENIRGVKCHTWEEAILSRLREYRQEEVYHLCHIALIRCGNQVLAWGGMVLLLIATWVTFHLLEKEMRADDVYTVLNLLNSLRTTMEIALTGLKLGSEGYAAWLRLQGYFSNSPLLTQERKGSKIKLVNASFISDDGTSLLSHLSLQWEKGILGIKGSVGSGKSTLLLALLGEMKLSQGEALFPSPVSYAQQTSWICKASVRENVIGHLPMNEERYHQVLSVCMLEEDLASLPLGDQTNAVTLSGGQKQRLALARCLYLDCDVYFLDDPFSALDQRVGWEVGQRVKAFLSGRIVLLVSGQERYLSLCESVITVEKGKIGGLESPPSYSPKTEVLTENKPFIRTDKVTSSSQHSSIWSIIRAYCQACGWPLFLCFTLLLLCQPLKIGFDWWLGRWIDDDYSLASSEYLLIYVALGGGFTVLFLVEGVLFPYATLRGGTRFLDRLHDALLSAPLLWHHKQTLGDLLNRASRDQSLIDETVSDTGHRVLIYGGMTLSTFVLLVIVLPWMALLLGLVAIGYLGCGWLFRQCIATLKQLEGTSRSQVHNIVSQDYQGGVILRAADTLSLREPLFLTALEANLRANYALFGFMRWFGLRAEILSGAILLGVCLLMVEEGTSAGTAGLVLAYTLQTVGALQWVMRLLLEEEVALLGVERVGTFATTIPKEKGGSERVFTVGDLSLSQVEVYYEGDKPALSLSLSIPQGECVGIKGRTGSGKSTLLSLLQRLIDYQGNVTFGDTELWRFDLKVLRQNIGILPQEPCFLLHRSLHWNMDPERQYPQEAIEAVLTRCQLQGLKDKLPFVLADLQLSSGQKQLLALSRLLLNKPAVVVMDEATASLDHDLAQTVEEIITSEFHGHTCLIVSHRDSALSRCQRVFTLSEGRIVP